VANIRQIRARIKAVRNIRTITKALELISAARLQRVHSLEVAARPPAAAVEQMLQWVFHSAGRPNHPLLRPGSGDVAGLVVLAADRGLCGGYNQRVAAAAVEAAEKLSAAGRRIRFYMVGNKGISLLRARLSSPAAAVALPEERLAGPHLTCPAFDEKRLHEEVSALAEELCAEHLRGNLASVHVVRMRVVSRLLVSPAVAQIIPVLIGPPPAEPVLHDFYPDAPAVLDVLGCLAVQVRLFQCFLEAAGGEHTARMLGMMAATRNADDMTRGLTRQLNRARQGRITAELAEVVGGADALKGSC